MVLRQDILEEFQCPICTEYMYPPIHECLRGHAFCKKCSEKLNNCPQCRSLIFYTENSLLQQLQEKLDFPCKFKENGCNFFSRINELKSHEMKCSYNSDKVVSGKWSERKKSAFYHLIFLFTGFLLFEMYFIFINKLDYDVRNQIKLK